MQADRVVAESCHAPSRPAIAALAAVLALAAFGLYIVGLRYTPVGDAVPHELLPISLLREGNLDFDEFVATNQPLPYWFVLQQGYVRSIYPIMPGLLNLPAFWIADRAGADLLSQRQRLSKYTAAAVSALSVAALFLALVPLCRRRGTAVLMAALYAVGTGVWSTCAQSLWQHGPSLLFLTVAFAALARPHSRWVPLAGLCLGLAVFNRPTNIVFALPCAVYVALHDRRRFPMFAAAAAVPAVLMGWYSLRVWGTVLALGQGITSSSTVGPHVRPGFHGHALPILPALLCSPARGLFVFSPMYLFTLPALAALRRRITPTPLPVYLAIGAALHLFLYSLWSVWWGGWCFGYRLLLEMLPSLTVLLALSWEQWIVRTRWARAVFWATVIVSVYCSFLGAFYFTGDWCQRVDIDRHPERVWAVRDTELRECHRRFVKQWAGTAHHSRGTTDTPPGGPARR